MFASPLKNYCQHVYMLAIVFSTCFSFATTVVSQVTAFPQSNQLYPRNTHSNKAEIRFGGNIEQSTGFKWLVLRKSRNGILVASKLIPLIYRNGIAVFRSEDEIKAELSTYRYDLFGSNGVSQTLIQSADNIVAGDAFIIQGQSNAVAIARGNLNTENDANSPANAPGRKFVRVYGSGSASGNYTKSWFTGDGNVWFETDGNTGQWGMRLASNLAMTQKTPICIFNGADPGQAINFFQRDDANPANPNTNYGRLLNRIREAGFEKNIRAVIWHQGESDAIGVLGQVQLTTDQYKQAFLNLQNAWKSDYKNLRKTYLFQIKYGCAMESPDGALQIQEAQRQLGLESKEITVMSTSAASQLFEGNVISYCHFNFQEGYQLFGDWMSHLIQRDIYNKKLPSSIEAPAPANAHFSGFASPGIASQISLSLKDKTASYLLNGDISGSFRLEGGNFTITDINLSGSNIIIDFARNPGSITNPTGLSFLGHEGNAAPILVNNNGIGLLYFSNISIGYEACTDKYENRNIKGAHIKFNKPINALISSSNDVDVFNFKTNKNIEQVKINLTNLPADYDLFLYNEKWELAGSSILDGNSPEQILINNTGKKDEFLIVIKGKNGAFDKDDCYQLNAEIVGSQKQEDGDENEEDDDDEGGDEDGGKVSNTARAMESGNSLEGVSHVLISPNPVRDQLNVTLKSAGTEKAELRLVDINGRLLQVHYQLLRPGKNLYHMNVGKVSPGIYLLQVLQNKKLTTRKVLITGP